MNVLVTLPISMLVDICVGCSEPDFSPSRFFIIFTCLGRSFCISSKVTSPMCRETLYDLCMPLFFWVMSLFFLSNNLGYLPRKTSHVNQDPHHFRYIQCWMSINHLNCNVFWKLFPIQTCPEHPLKQEMVCWKETRFVVFTFNECLKIEVFRSNLSKTNPNGKEVVDCNNEQCQYYNEQ